MSSHETVSTGGGAAENLDDRRYVSVILRLVVNHAGRMERGDLVDTAGVLRGRFASWQELIARLQHFLEEDASRDA